jgi:hypothetical protein
MHKTQDHTSKPPTHTLTNTHVNQINIVVLEAHTLLQYGEVMASFENKKAADFAGKLIRKAMKGKKMSSRSVRPYNFTRKR